MYEKTEKKVDLQKADITHVCAELITCKTMYVHQQTTKLNMNLINLHE